MERNGGLRRWTPGCGPSRERVEDPAAHLPADRVTGLTWRRRALSFGRGARERRP